MPGRRRSITALTAAVAVVAFTLVAATTASAFTFTTEFKNWVVSGSLTPKKLNQPVNLPPGSTFNGSATLEVTKGAHEGAVEGPVTGNLFVPPFKATLSVAGVPETVGVKLVPVNPVEGSISPGDGPFQVILSVPTKAIIDITSVSTLGAEVPLSCETEELVTINLSTELNAFELLSRGANFTGTTTFPSIRCGGLVGLTEGPLLTTLFSGPDNPYSITIAPPT